MRDGTGLMYRRNRYYDPQTGRFTQLDPIGLAGGANGYGFAEGDPVNFDDPFGLLNGGCRTRIVLACAFVSYVGDMIERHGLSADVPSAAETEFLGGAEDAMRNLRNGLRLEERGRIPGSKGLARAEKDLIPTLLSRASGSALGRAAGPILRGAAKVTGVLALAAAIYENVFDVGQVQTAAICKAERCENSLKPREVPPSAVKP